MTVLQVWSPTKSWFWNGPNLPAVPSFWMPEALWPILLYGNPMAGGTNSGILARSTGMRLLLAGSFGRGPMLAAFSYHRLPVGLPTKPPGLRCLSQQVPFQGPWLSV